jgi:hypothetical protein
MKAKFTMNVTLTEGRDQAAIDWLRTQPDSPQDIIRRLLREAAMQGAAGQQTQLSASLQQSSASHAQQPAATGRSVGGDVPVASFGAGSPKPAAGGLLGSMLDQG